MSRVPAPAAGPLSYIGGLGPWLLCAFIAVLCLWQDGDFAELYAQQALGAALCVTAIAAAIAGVRPGLGFTICAVAYAAAVSLSAWFASAADAEAAGRAWRGAVEAWWLAGVAIGVSTIARRGRARAVAFAVLIACVVVTLLGTFGPRSAPDAFGRYLRYAAASQWGAYPEIGMLAILGAAATTALALATDRLRTRLAAAALTVFFAAMPLIVGSRSALGALAVVVLWLCGTALVKWRGRLALALAIGIVLAGVAAGALRWRAIERAGSQTGASLALSERVAHWRAAAAMFADHPVFGVGPGGFPRAYPRYQAGVALPNAHNMVLHVAAETGLLACVPFLGLWGIVLWRSWKASEASVDGAVAFAIHGLLMVFFIRNLSDQFLAGVHSSLRTSMLLAVLLGLGDVGGGTSATASWLFRRRQDRRSV